ncbi:MAG: metallophosphoesterase [Novosphingobium sp.]
MFTVIAWHFTMARPVVHQADIALPLFPESAPAVRVVLMSDLHVSGPDMPPSRLDGIVRQINASQPDVVAIAGDFISDKLLATKHYSYRDALAPLSGLKPRLGTVAVLGNHDHWRNGDEARRELQRIGVVVLQNEAVRMGPLAIGGVDDTYTVHSDVKKTAAAMDRLGGAQIILSHSPDVFPAMPGNGKLILAGHTHCGQIRYPWGGTPAPVSRFGERYSCGRIDENGRTLIVTGGLGTSILPFRLFSTPDIWLITVHAPVPTQKGAQTTAQTPFR